MLAAIGAFVVLKVKNTDPVIEQSEALTFLINPTKSQVFIKDVEGTPADKPVQADFAQIDTEAKLKDGSVVKTSASGRASILSPDKSITNVGPDAEIVINTLPDNLGTKVKIQSGSVWSRIVKFSGSGSVYEMQTENVVGAVRGTAFSTTFVNGITSLCVLDGTVWANAIDPKTGQKVPGEVFVVPAGNKIIVDSNNMPTDNSRIQMTPITAEDFNRISIKENWDGPSRSRDLPDVESKPQNPTQPTPQNTPTNTTPSNPSATSTPAQNPTQTPVAPPAESVPTLKSVEPSVAVIFKDIIGHSPEITLKGEKLSQVQKVLLDLNEISFKIISDTEIRANVPSTFKTGVYDVSILFSSNKNSTLYDILEVKWEPPEQTRQEQYY